MVFLSHSSPLVSSLAAAFRLYDSKPFRMVVVRPMDGALFGFAQFSCRAGLARTPVAQRDLAQLWDGALGFETVAKGITSTAPNANRLCQVK